MLAEFGKGSQSLLDVPSGKRKVVTPGRGNDIRDVFRPDEAPRPPPIELRRPKVSTNGDSTEWFAHTNTTGERSPVRTSLKIKPRESRNVLQLPLDYRMGKKPVAPVVHAEEPSKPMLRIFPRPRSVPFEGVPEIKRGRRKFDSPVKGPPDEAPLEAQLGQRRKVDHAMDPVSKEIDIVTLRPRGDTMFKFNQTF